MASYSCSLSAPLNVHRTSISHDVVTHFQFKTGSKNIDGYLEPLIKKLKDLWIAHGEIYALNENFHMHAPLLWTIKDFQYMLSFRVVTLKIS